MSISVYYIEGRKGSACNNDAFSIVENERRAIDFVPASSGLNPVDLKVAFTEAQVACGSNVEALCQRARKKLGL